MTTKQRTTVSHHLFLYACATGLCLCLTAGPAHALETTTSTYGSVNVFKFDLYAPGEAVPEGLEGEESSWRLDPSMKDELRRVGDLWAERLGPGSALATGAGGSLTAGIPFVVHSANVQENAYAGSPPNAHDSMTGAQRALIDATAPELPGVIGVGLLYGLKTGSDFAQLPIDSSFLVAMYHEMGHALGVTSRANNRMNEEGVQVLNEVSVWDTRLYDKYGARLDAGATVTSKDPGQAGSGLFYVGESTDSGVTFRGDHVAEVLSDGRVKTASPDYALTVEGREGDRFDLSHIELERSLMSHQAYRNQAVFMEAELAALQDIGYKIDRRNFYGVSVYSDNSTLTYTDGYHGRDYDPASDTGRWTDAPNTATLGVGLHIYGKGNTVTVGQNNAGTGDVLAHGEAAAGARVDGSGNTLIIGADARPLTVSADGTNGTGLLASYGKDHVIAIGAGASVTARGEGGVGARFDFGHNLLGDRWEYRGSHIRRNSRGTLSVSGKDDNGFDLNLDGPLVRDFTVAGTLAGGTAANDGAALFISDNARVGKITIKSGATVSGDIISRWNVQNEDIQYSGKRSDLYTTLTLEQGAVFDGDIDGVSGLNLVNQGFVRSADGKSVLNVAAVHNLDNRADLAVAQELTTSGVAKIAGSTLTLEEGARADFQGGLDLRSGGTLKLDEALVSVGRGAAVRYDAGSALQVGTGLFRADAASFFSLNSDGATVTLAAGADRLVSGLPDGALMLRLAQDTDAYSLAQWADAKAKLGLGGADLSIYGTLSDEVRLSMRGDTAHPRFTGFDAPTAYGVAGNPQIPYAPFNAVRLEDATGALLSPSAMTITDGDFALSHWVTGAEAVALTVGGDSDLWISGAASGHGIFEKEGGASGARTSLALTDAARLTLGGESQENRVAMPLDRVSTAADTTLTLVRAEASASSVNASGALNVKDSALKTDALTLNGSAFTLDAGEVRTGSFTVMNGASLTSNNSVLAATGPFVLTPGASLAGADAHVISGRDLAVQGAFTLDEKGVMTVRQGAFTADELTLSGQATAGGIRNNLVMFDGSEAAVRRLTLDVDSGYGVMTMNAGRAVLGSIELGSGALAVLNSGVTADAFGIGADGSLTLITSRFAAQTLTGDIGGKLDLQTGALAALGMDADNAAAAARAAGMTLLPAGGLGDGRAALVLGAPVTLGPRGNLGILVPDEPPGDAPDFDPDVYFGEDSLLVVDAATLKGGAAITATSKDSGAMTAKGASLRVLGATVKGVDILDNFGGGLSLDGWTEVTTSDRMLSLSARLADADTVSVFADLLDPLQVFPGLGKGMSATMREVWGLGKNNVNSPYGGIRLLSRAARDDYMADAREAVRTMESVTHAVLAAGVPDMTFTVNSAASSVAGDRMSLVQSGREGAENADALPYGGKTGIALWAIPLFQDWKSRDLEAGVFEMDLDGSLGGLSLGADYTFEAAVRAGLAFHVGNGRMRSRGDFNDTENDSRFWGLGAYAGWAPGAFSLSADAHYTRTDNKVQQALPFDLGMGDLRGDIHASAVSAGLRGEYVFATQWLDITPHLGVRYTRLHTAQHDLGSAGLSVLEGESIKQDIWSFPVGLTFSRDFQHGEAWLRPLLDLTIIPYAGDTEAWSVARFSGVDAAVGMSTRVLDSVTYGGQIGLEAGNSKVNLGVHYGLQMGEHSTRHGVFATFRYGF